MKKNPVEYNAVIGLEVHVQLNTESKLFSSDPNEFGAAPNSNVSVISLGHPGSLPRLNGKVAGHAVRLGLAVGSEIAPTLVFARKNYFYTDLPKGYQISQHESPVCLGGWVSIRIPGSGTRKIRLIRIHLEEDAGKSLHDRSPGATLVDLNRAGVPLLEIVSEPDIRSAGEAALYLAQIRRLVRFLGISDGNMEEGSLRCDANVSIRRKEDRELGIRTEIKNLNSITNVRKAIEYEIMRQAGILSNGGKVVQQTLSYDARENITFPLREKEEADDYRYFPEPDLNPLLITREFIEEIRASMPMLPETIYRELTTEHDLPPGDAEIIIESPEFAGYYQELSTFVPDRKPAANWMIGPVKAWLNENRAGIAGFPLNPRQLARLIELVEGGRVSYTSAQQRLFPAMLERPGADPGELAIELDLLIESGQDAILKQVKDALGKYPEKVSEYHQGKKGLIGLFMGEVMKISGGRADPGLARKLLTDELNKRK